jgi:hypothetical protein
MSYGPSDQPYDAVRVLYVGPISSRVLRVDHMPVSCTMMRLDMSNLALFPGTYQAGERVTSRKGANDIIDISPAAMILTA